MRLSMFQVVMRSADETDDPLALTRADLVRLVVGMQWQVAVQAVYSTEVVQSDRQGMWLDPVDDGSDLRPAVDIVDEWLGVR